MYPEGAAVSVGVMRRQPLVAAGWHQTAHIQDGFANYLPAIKKQYVGGTVSMKYHSRMHVSPLMLGTGLWSVLAAGSRPPRPARFILPPNSNILRGPDPRATNESMMVMLSAGEPCDCQGGRGRRWWDARMPGHLKCTSIDMYVMV